MSLQTLLEQIKELEVLSHLPDRLCSAFLGNQLPSLDTKCKPKCTAVLKYITVWTSNYYIFKSGTSPTNSQVPDKLTNEKKGILLFLGDRIDFSSKDKCMC